MSRYFKEKLLQHCYFKSAIMISVREMTNHPDAPIFYGIYRDRIRNGRIETDRKPKFRSSKEEALRCMERRIKSYLNLGYYIAKTEQSARPIDVFFNE
jgi:hypothetical protein